MCEFTMSITGPEASRNMFLDALEQNGTTWIGSGASNVKVAESDPDYLVVTGRVKRSVGSSLISDAVSLKTQQQNGQGSWQWNKGMDLFSFLSLPEACEEFGVSVDVVSESVRSGLSEKITVNASGKITDRKAGIYRRIDIGGIESYEEFLEKYPEEENLISENEFSRGISRGFLETGRFQLDR